MANELTNPFIGKWSYRSFLNDPNLDTQPNDLLFGSGTLEFTSAPIGQVAGTIGGPGWQLKLEGWMTFGNPPAVRFQGKGVIGKAEWIYDYNGYYVTHWPNGVDQVEAITGSVIRTIPHPGNGGTSPAGVVVSFYAVRQS
jgi:hypothetical protein